MSKRTSYNVLGQFLNSDQRQAFLTHLAQYRPTTVVIMDELDLCHEAYNITGGETRVIYRRHHDRDGSLFETWTPAEYCAFVTDDYQLGLDIMPYVLNEPDMRSHKLPILIRFLIEVADILETWGYSAVIGNLGVANINHSDIETGVYDPLLLRAATWPHLMGYHSYADVLAPFGVGYWSIDDLKDPAKVQPELWPEITSDVIQALMAREEISDQFKALIPVDPEVDHYWHILREEWLQQRAVDIGAGRHKYVITECVWDRMPDIDKQSDIHPYLEQTYGTAGRLEIRGAPTLTDVWAAYFPDWTRDRAAYEQCLWLERNLPDECVGWNIFCWCFDDHLVNKKVRWERNYNIGNWYEFQQLNVDNRNKPAKPPVEPPPNEPIIPLLSGWPLYLILFTVACVLGVTIYSLIMSANVSAQGVTIMEDLLNQLFAIPAIAPIAFSGAIILYLVEVGKRLKSKYIGEEKAEWLTPQFMVMFWVIVFMGAFAIAEQYAYDNVFKQIAELVTQLVAVLGPYVLGAIGTQVAVAVAHKRIRQVDTAGFDQ